MRADDYRRTQQTRLDAAGVSDAVERPAHLIARRLRIPRLELALAGDAELTDDDCRALDGETARLAAGEPLAYILGDLPFHTISLQCDRRALIPRPETEWMVDQVLRCDPVWRAARPRLADVGTGTGCIALALAAQRPQARILAIDRDPESLALARENRARLGLEASVELRLGDLLTGLPEDSLDVVVSNPPYIPTSECERLDASVREYEPRAALDGGPDGLAIIRRLVSQAIRILAPGGSLWMEIGHDQGPAVAAILRTAGFSAIRVERDWHGLDRLASGWRMPPGKDCTRSGASIDWAR